MMVYVQREVVRADASPLRRTDTRPAIRRTAGVLVEPSDSCLKQKIPSSDISPADVAADKSHTVVARLLRLVPRSARR